jgi:imidazoleglycerol-phosphate dehydratase
MNERRAQVSTRTRETDVTLELVLDGSGQAKVDTQVGFYDHMLTALAVHAGFDLTITVRGDLAVDDHHTVEDTALALGRAFDEALGERRGIVRFGSAYAPLDEALARAVVDISGRPFARTALGLGWQRLGAMASENLPHALSSFAMAARLTLHVDVLTGENDHHRAEAAFKAVALALRQAVRQTGSPQVPSTKGVLR